MSNLNGILTIRLYTYKKQDIKCFCVFWRKDMLINGVKITLIICLTIIVTCVLGMSYSEYLNRYSLITTQDNGLYIFDKKNTILNRCNDNGCKVIETHLPDRVRGGLGMVAETINQAQKTMFGRDKSMQEEITTAEAIKTEKLASPEPASAPATATVSTIATAPATAAAPAPHVVTPTVTQQRIEPVKTIQIDKPIEQVVEKTTSAAK